MEAQVGMTDGLGAHGNADTPDVLLVESDPKDARLVAEGFQRASISLEVAPDGRTAIERLSTSASGDSNLASPRLVVLDLAVPDLDGTTVLDAIKSGPRLRTTPVIVFTNADATADVERAYELGANAYVVKPSDVESFVAAVESIAEFWFGAAQLPTERLSTDRF